MKKQLFTLIMGVLYLFTGTYIFSQTKLTDEELKWAEENPVIRVHNETNWAPFNFNENGIPKGFSIDFMDKVAESVGLRVEYISGPTWNEFLEMIKNGEIDVMLNIVKTPERQTYLEYTQSYVKNPNVILSMEDEEYRGLEELDGKAVSVIKGSYHEEILKKEYPNIKLHLTDDLLGSIKAVIYGEADATLGELSPLNYQVKTNFISGVTISGELKLKGHDTDDLFIATQKDNKMLLSILDKGISQVTVEEKTKLMDKWIVLDAEKKLELTREEIEWIKKNPVIRVHNETNWAPFNFNERGIPKGFSIDFMDKVAENTGLRVEYVSGPTWNEFLEMIKNGEIDVMLNIVKTPERQTYLGYTQPYVKNPNVILSMEEKEYRSLEELEGKTVSIQKGFYHEEILKAEYPNIKLHLTDDVMDSIKAVIYGDADAALGELSPINYLLKTNFISGVSISGELKLKGHVTEDLRIATQKENKMLLSILDKGVSLITDEEKTKLMDKWTTLGTEEKLVLTREEVEWIKKNPVIRVHNETNWAPFNFNEDGIPKGFAVDMMAIISSKAGLEVEYITGPTWKEFIEVFKEGDIDVLLGVVKTPEREEYMAFSQSFASNPNAILSRLDTQYKNLEELDGKIVSVPRGFYQEEVLRTEYPNIELHLTDNLLDSIKAVFSRNADATFGQLAVLNYLVRSNFISEVIITGEVSFEGYDFEELYMTTQFENKELLSILNKGIASMTLEEKNTLINKWLPPTRKDTLELTDEEREWLKENRELRLGIYRGWPPFSYLNSEGEFSGAISEYIKIISEKLEINMEAKKDLSWSQMLKEAKKGRIDVVAGIARTEEREESLLFTKPYLELPMVIVAREDSPMVADIGSLEGKKIAVVEGSMVQHYMERDYPEHQLLLYDETSKALKAVAEEKAFAAIDSIMSINYSSKKMGLDKIEVISTTPYIVELSIGVSKRYPELVPILDKVLYSFSEDEKHLIETKWTEMPIEKEIDWIFLWKIATLVVLILGSIFTSIIIWNRKLVSEIKKRKEAERKIIETMETTNKIIDNSPVPMAVVDTSSEKIMRANDAMVEFNLLSTEELYKHKLTDIYVDAENYRSEIMKGLQIEKGIENYEVQVKRIGTGEKRWTLFSSHLLKYMEKQALIFTMIDIEDIKRIHTELEEAKEKAEGATKAKSEFLANMSHEIRTPMNAILGLNDLLKKTEMSGKQRDYVDKVGRSATNLLGIINDILDFSKIESGKMDIELTSFNLDTVLEGLSNISGFKSAEKGIEFVIERDNLIPDSLIGDPLRIGQILLNLTNNAIKFTGSGEVLLKVSSKNIDTENAELKFEVKDTGIGLTEEQRKKLFTAFTQADASTTRKYGGTGLGLSISKHLVNLMGGEIGVDSVYGKGSNFFFTITLKTGEHIKKKTIAKELKGLRVMVADDNESARRVMDNYLTDFSFETILVSSGEEAVSEFESSISKGKKIDLILMDLKMDGIDGIEAWKHIKERIEGEDTLPKIMMVTAYGREDIVERAKKEGIEIILMKPVSQSVLFDNIMEIFGVEGKILTHRKAGREYPEGFEEIRGAKILVVEDNLINQDVIKAILEDEGFHVHLEDNGQKTIETLESGGEFDVVLMDLQMPVLDGYETSIELRKKEKYRDLPIIALSADAMSGTKKKVEEAGMNGYVTKPIDKMFLYETLVKFIEPGKRDIFKGEKEGKVEEGLDARVKKIVREIDTAEGLKRVAGNTKLYIEILKRFRENNMDFVDGFRKGLAETERDENIRSAHTLKGVAGNIGAKKVYELAKELEGRLKENEEVDSLLDSIEVELKTICQEVEALISEVEEKKESRGAEEINFEVLQEDMRGLKKLLEDYDTDAEEKLAGIKSQLLSRGVDTILRDVESCVNNYDFETALDHLEKLEIKVRTLEEE